MKFGTYTPSNFKIENVKIFRPFHTLLIKVNANIPANAAEYQQFTGKLNASLVDSTNGNQETVIPYLEIDTLSEIAMYHQGHVKQNGSYIVYPVLFNPVGSLKLDNNKYLELDFSNLQFWNASGNINVTSIELFGIDEGQTSDFIAKYMKMAAPAGVSRHVTSTTGSEVLVMPKIGFDSIQLTFKSGVVSEFTATEWDFIMSKYNDVTSVWTQNQTVTETDSALGNVENIIIPQYLYSGSQNYIYDLNGVQKIEIIRDSDNASAFEFVLCDFIKN